MDLSTRRLLAAAAPVGRLISLLVLWTYVGSSAPAAVRLGVVLDLTSAGGMKSLACISMALDDFYLKHPSYATRVELRVRDSRGDPVAAAQAVEELMDKDAQVQAIISPQTSLQWQADIFSGIVERGSNIPILSSSTTAPTPTSSRSRFLVGTAPNISSQAAPIAAILEAFAWRGTALLHEDSPYGVGILSTLIHTFQGSRALTDSVAVASDATDIRLDAALLALKSMPTRVYIVHMPHALAARLFSRAVVAGMMSEGYVWIATACVGNYAVDSLANDGHIHDMQGVISLFPHVPVTEQVRSFSRRFKVKLRQESPDDDEPVWLLWLYDTAWAAAAAAEVSGAAAQRTTFLDALLATEFDGLAGRFRLVDGQLQVSAYEILNIIGKGTRAVGFWTPEFGISTKLLPERAGTVLKQVLWPGETAAVPTGWNQTQLRVAVPVKIGFNQFVDTSHRPSTDRERVSGYCIDVFQAVMTRLNHPVAYKYVPVNENMESYDKLVNLVRDKKFDVVAGDVTITSSRVKRVSFTMPFTDMGWSMIMAKKEYRNYVWFFTKPMTPELWFTSLAFFFFTGLVVWAIEHRINARFSGTPSKQLGVLLYFAFSTMVFSHKEKLESNLSKFVVIMWLFVVLILTTSYAANLTSLLTVQQLQPAMNDWTDRDYVGFQEGSFIAGLLMEMGFDETRFRGYSSMDQYADALDKGSDHGGVTAIFDEVPYLRLFLSRHCHGYSMVGPIYKSGGFGFVFPMGSPLAADVSLAILELAEEYKLERIESKWFSSPGACVSRSNDDADARLGLRRFGGLFLINAVVSCLMLLIHLVSEKHARSNQLRPDAAAGGGEPVGDGHGAAELHSMQVLADGGADQQAAMEDSPSAPMDATVSDEILAPVGGSSMGQSVHEPTERLDVNGNAAQGLV